MGKGRAALSAGVVFCGAIWATRLRPSCFAASLLVATSNLDEDPCRIEESREVVLRAGATEGRSSLGDRAECSSMIE